MIKTLVAHIKYGVGLIKHSMKDVGIKAKRSSKWPALEKSFKEQFPTCACCGTNKKVQIHHVKPFHVFPELELDPSNLISVCMDTKMCHLKLGHGFSFRAYSPDIRKYAEQINKKEKSFEELYVIAKNNRLFL